MCIFIMVHLIGVKVYGFSHNFRGGKGNKIEIRGLSRTLNFTPYRPQLPNGQLIFACDW